MNIQEIRAQYPQYDDLPDHVLAEGLHQKYYSDIPFEDFASKIEFIPAQTVAAGTDATMDPYVPIPEPTMQGPSALAAVKDRVNRYVDDFTQQEEQQLAQEYDLEGVGLDVGEYSGPVAPGEAALSAVTGIAAAPVAGFAGLATLATGQGLERATEEVGRTLESLTYKPRTKGGEEILIGSMAPIMAFEALGQVAGDKTLEKTKLPALAAAVHTIITTLPVTLPFAWAKIKPAIENSGLYRRLSIKERGLVMKSIEESFKEGKISAGQLARREKGFKEAEIAKRAAGEVPPVQPKPSPQEPVSSVKPQAPTSAPVQPIEAATPPVPKPKAIKQKPISAEGPEAVARANPIYNVIAQARKTPINLEVLYRDYDTASVKQILNKFPAIFSKKGTVDPDVFAMDNGFKSLDDMMETLKAAPKLKDAIKKATDEETALNERYGDVDIMMEEGFEPVYEKRPAGNLKAGEIIRTDAGGIIPIDDYKVKGYEGGQVVLEDGDTFKLDPWEMVDVAGIKESGEKPYTETQTALESAVKEEIGTSQETGAITIERPSRISEGETFAFQDPVIEKEFQAAKGIKSIPRITQIKDFLRTIGHKFARDFEHLPKTKENAQLRFSLKKLATQRQVASDETLRNIQGVTVKLNKQEYDLFTRKVILDDLAATAAEGKELPFGFTGEIVATELGRIEQSMTSEVAEAVTRRKELWSGLTEEYRKAQADIGFDISDKLTRQDYFRHQILEYVNEKGIFGTGERLKTPTARGHLKERKGSELAINTDFIQAEHEVMAQMLYDIQVAETIKTIDNHYNKAPELKEKGRKENYVAIVGGPENMRILNRLRGERAEILSQEVIDSYDKQRLKVIGEQIRELDPTMPFRQKIAIGLKSLEREGFIDMGFEDELPFTAIAKLAKDGNISAKTILKTVAEREKFIKETLGKEYLNHRQFIDNRLIPEKYVPWQPREGNIFYMSDTVPAQIMETALAQGLDVLEVPMSDLRKTLAVGGKREQFIIPEEVAKTLNALTREHSKNVLARGHRRLINAWKQWQLLMPRRYFKYNFRNLTGDADGAFAGSPSVFKKVPQAVVDLYDVYAKNKPLTPDLKDWFRRGGMNSTLQAQEMGQMNELTMFRKFLDKQNIKSKNIPELAWKKYWKSVRLTTDFREAVLRYAAYLRAKEVLSVSKNGLPTKSEGYWASDPEYIKGLTDIKDRAFAMSNDLLGAYDSLSVVGQALREHLIPFWSWKEVNMRRYAQLARNAAASEKLTGTIGRKLVGTAIRSPFTAMRIGAFALKAMAFWIAIQVYNNTMFPEEENELPEEVRTKPHIILGRNKDGTIDYFSRLGALPDLLEWFALDAAPYYVHQWLNGKMTLKEIGKEMAKSPVNVITQGIEPVIKIVGETFTRRSLFPDAFNPRTVRNRGLHIARSLGLENEYIALADLPTRGYKKSIKGVFAYTIDPLQAAYSDTYSRKRDFLKRKGKFGEGFFITPSGNALYNVRLALRYKDIEAAQKYMLDYLEIKGADTPEKVIKAIKNIERSLKRMDPLSGMTIAEKNEFVEQLDQSEKEDLAKAIKFYESVTEINLEESIHSPQE